MDPSEHMGPTHTRLTKILILAEKPCIKLSVPVNRKKAQQKVSPRMLSSLPTPSALGLPRGPISVDHFVTLLWNLRTKRVGLEEISYFLSITNKDN